MSSFDDPRFNYKFVALVEQHPWIYDTTHPDYAVSEKIDEGWQSVVHQLEGGVTIQDCKARWRNIRGRFTKYIKAYSEDNSTTPYYLASSLRFVLPFMKNRVCLTNAQYERIGTEPSFEEISDSSSIFTPAITLNEVEIIESSESEDEEIELKPVCVLQEESLVEPIRKRQQSEEGESLVKPLPIRKRRQSVFGEDRPPSSRKQRQSVLEPTTSTESARKRPRPAGTPEQASSSSGRNEEVFVNSSSSVIDFDPQAMQRDCDVMFLLSLLPDFKNMNERQKRKFKAGVMNLTFDVMEEN